MPKTNLHPHALLTRAAFEEPLDAIAAADARDICHPFQLSAWLKGTDKDKFLITLIRLHVTGEAHFIDDAE